MLRRLKLDRFKNFLDAELSMGPFTLLVGANAAGKSRLMGPGGKPGDQMAGCSERAAESIKIGEVAAERPSAGGRAAGAGQ